MDVRNTRALQSKINLQFNIKEFEKEKELLKPKIQQKVLDDFEKTYALNCDKEKQRLKNINVS